MSTIALVPVRTLGEGKSRLAGVLSPPRRASLVRGMLERVLGTLRATPGISAVVVVTPDPSLPVPPGVEIIRDADSGLNDAITLALARIAGRAAGALIVAADAPRATAAEFETILDAARAADVVVVPDRRGQGTNALWLRLPARISPQYGADSARQHVASAQAAGLRVTTLELAGLSHDIDVPADLGPEPIPDDQALLLADEDDLATLMARAAELAMQGFGRRISYSRKVFIPLTQLCRDVCHYCTFAGPPRRGQGAFLSVEQVLEIARAGARAGCDEALFTLGDKPELRYRVVREELTRLGFSSTLDYLGHCAKRVFEETGLLPHLNSGVMNREDLAALRPVSASMGLMLESAAERLCERGGPHHRSPDKRPAVRLATLEAAGELAVPFTSGILIGIGETRRERIEALLAIRDVHQRHGHIQEIIVQNFRAKPGTRMAAHADASPRELLWTTAVARLVFGPSMSIQVPPNLSDPRELESLVAAGINDWGGVSPVTPDHVNPEAPWPELLDLERRTAAAGRWLVQRLPIAPSHARELSRWVDPALQVAVRRRLDAFGYARERGWTAGAGDPPPARYRDLIRDRGPRAGGATAAVGLALDRIVAGHEPDEPQLVALLSAEGLDFQMVVAAADALRARTCGDDVTYVVNRNINYTNICTYSCGFCAFAKGRSARALRGPGYDLDLDEIGARVAEAWGRGATEVCLQGGIHPKYTGDTYLDIVRAAKSAAPAIHVHAFSPLEVMHGATTLGLSVRRYLERLAEAGLRTLPGTAAEILCDDVREVLCADKLNTREWLGVMRDAHAVGLRSTATIMFGHVEEPRHWARHLLEIRALQRETGGFTEFVPLPFVHMEAPLWRKGFARSGPSFREAILMHAVARLALEPLLRNVQASWVKLGREGALLALRAGANDFGGVLMNESITRAAGGVNGQEMDAAAMDASIRSIGRIPRQRTTLYGVPAGRHPAADPPAAARPNNAVVA